MADLPNIDFNRIEIPKFPKLPRATVAAIIAGLVVVLTGFSTLYQVQPEEVGVVPVSYTHLTLPTILRV